MTHWEQGRWLWLNKRCFVTQCCRDTATRPVFLCLGWCGRSEGQPWERPGPPFSWLLKVWNHLSVGESQCWEGLGSRKKLGSGSGMGRALEAWSYSWFCQVLTFQTLGLSINVLWACFPIWKMEGNLVFTYLYLTGERISYWKVLFYTFFFLLLSWFFHNASYLKPSAITPLYCLILPLLLFHPSLILHTWIHTCPVGSVLSWFPWKKLSWVKNRLVCWHYCKFCSSTLIPYSNWFCERTTLTDIQPSSVPFLGETVLTYSDKEHSEIQG